MRRITELLGPMLLVVVVAAAGSRATTSFQLQVLSVLVTTAIVVALYVFVGNSGVLSFGHITFVALGAFAAGLATVPPAAKSSAFPEMFGFIADLEMGNIESLLLATAVGGGAALFVGIPIVRLSGLPAGIATFAVLIITNNILRNWEKIGPGAKTLALVPRSTGFLQATIAVLVIIGVAYAYQGSRHGRMLRASRENEAAAASIGVNIRLERLVAFTISGALAGLGGGLLVHLLGSITTQQVFLDLTFLTLAMLVVGGIGSLWGAVVGALVVAGLDSLLAEAERGAELFGVTLTVPGGTRLVGLGIVLLVVLAVRPRGLTGSRELTLPSLGPPSGIEPSA